MPKTIWTLDDAKKKHRHSPGLAAELATVLPIGEPVLDLGCGCGFYLRYLADCGYVCLGVEGTPGIQDIALFSKIIQADLSKPLILSWPRSSILCLEVGEHLLPEDEPQLIATIDAFCSRWLIMSWAIPGQRGTGHNNCRSNEYVCERFSKLGFAPMPQVTSHLRKSVEEHTRYFRNTIQAFYRHDERDNRNGRNG